MAAIATLLSDFGEQDPYVGIMKGVIASINPAISTIDLTHLIPPQDVAAGRFALANAVPYFPTGTVHIAVVDPGVGSVRRGVAIAFEQGYLVGPDNGLFSGVLSRFAAIEAVELTDSQYWRTREPSRTFHGRDIFAPCGAHLATQIPLQELGTPIDPATLVDLPFPLCRVTPTGIRGAIQSIDTFGNLITNIPATALTEKNWSVLVGDILLPSSQTYSDRSPGEFVALIGSHGWLEIALNQGSASDRLQLTLGAEIEVLFRGTLAS